MTLDRSQCANNCDSFPNLCGLFCYFWPCVFGTKWFFLTFHEIYNVPDEERGAHATVPVLGLRTASTTASVWLHEELFVSGGVVH
mmetsp:Transcript_54997/g.145192  ORF Transcript_54997/g.145192 Transcript_54997/m.145192 type:complete len:85 (+) Transcript_54997:433-687(+)